MLKKSVLLNCFLVLLHFGYGQRLSPTVIAVAGGSNQAGGIRLDWTLGELAVETALQPSGIYTQGFHQPLLKVEFLPGTAPVAGIYTVSVYPNPFNSFFTVAINSAYENKLVLKLTDINGLVLYNNTAYSKGSTVKVDMRQFASGIYILTVTDTKGAVISTRKIVKTS